jgi:hypothetical protein
MSAVILPFKKVERDWERLLEDTEKSHHKRVRYLDILNWLRENELRMSNKVPTKEWFALKNKIREIERRIKLCV